MQIYNIFKLKADDIFFTIP